MAKSLRNEFTMACRVLGQVELYLNYLEKTDKFF